MATKDNIPPAVTPAQSSSVEAQKPEQPSNEEVKNSGAKGPALLRFGIPTLDWLFARDANALSKRGIRLRPDKDIVKANGNNEVDANTGMTTSIAIIGKSGTGKSILGLHLASRFYADSRACEEKPFVLYVSTDFKLAQAKRAWEDFALLNPNSRHTPLDKNLPGKKSPYGGDESLTIDFKEHKFGRDDTALFRALKAGAPQGDEVYFVDLATQQAGDDWAYLMRLIELLPNNGCKHLILLDALEGLEVLAGTTDRFGRIRQRRSQVAELLRRAGDKCHVAFILEEGDDDHVPPEEFVSDTVIRLASDNKADADFTHRKVEVLKCRSQQHARGRHRYFIRPIKKKEAVSGGNAQPEELPDDPFSENGYFYVAHSLDFLSHVLSIPESSVTQSKVAVSGHGGKEFAAFYTPKIPRTLPHFGLPRGSVTVLTGDEATYKSRLGRAFLAGGLERKDRVNAETNVDKDKLNAAGHTKDEVLIYFTTQQAPPDMDITKQLSLHLITSGAQNLVENPRRAPIIARELDSRSLDSATMMHLIDKCILKGIADAEKREIPSDHVRVVIDDWSVMKANYPALAKDPLFLPYLIRYLKKKRVTALIIETAPGRPSKLFDDTESRQLRALAAQHLVTWHVDFYGQRRVAIAAVPPMRDGMPDVVAELRPPPESDLKSGSQEDERLWGDRHFELYRDLEDGHAKPVALEVHLFSSNPGFEDYLRDEHPLFDRLFTAAPGKLDASPGTGDETHVLRCNFRKEYPSMRDYSRLHGDLRTEHSVVLQVDEYWQPLNGHKKQGTEEESKEEEGLGGFPYLAQRVHSQAHVKDEGGQAIDENDPYQLFQQGDAGPDAVGGEKVNDTGTGQRRVKQDYFWPPDYGDRQAWRQKLNQSGLVPYHWDFGFIMVNRTIFESVKERLRMADTKQPEESNTSATTETDKWVKYIEAFLPAPRVAPKSGSEPGAVSGQAQEPVQLSWLEFFNGCSAAYRESGVDCIPFDLDMLSPQSFACLVLEVWLSTIVSMSPNETNSAQLEKLKEQVRLLSEKRTDDNGVSIASLLTATEGKKALAIAWVELAKALAQSSIAMAGALVTSREGAVNAVAQRQWYVTGAAHPWNKDANFIPVPLPGSFVTRGDWFLTVGRESQSQALGERAIDLLCSRRSNMVRLERGLGLPVRDLFHAEAEKDTAKDTVIKDTAKDTVIKDTAKDTVIKLQKRYRTALRRKDAQGNPNDCWSYAELLRLEGMDGSSKSKPRERWLWRSKISDYLECDRIWERWLARFYEEARTLMVQGKSDKVVVKELMNLVEEMVFVIERAGQVRSHLPTSKP